MSRFIDHAIFLAVLLAAKLLLVDGTPLMRDRSLADAFHVDPAAVLEVASSNASQPSTSSASTTYNQPIAVKAAVTSLAGTAALLVAVTYWLLMAKSSHLLIGFCVPHSTLKANVESILMVYWRRFLHNPTLHTRQPEPNREKNVAAAGLREDVEETSRAQEGKENKSDEIAPEKTALETQDRQGAGNKNDDDRSTSPSESSSSYQARYTTQPDEDGRINLFEGLSLIYMATLNQTNVRRYGLLELARKARWVEPARSIEVVGDSDDSDLESRHVPSEHADRSRDEGSTSTKSDSAVPAQRAIRIGDSVGVACGYADLANGYKVSYRVEIEDSEPTEPSDASGPSHAPARSHSSSSGPYPQASSLGEPVADHPASWLPIASSTIRTVVQMMIWEWITMWIVAIMFWSTLLYNGYIGGSTPTSDRYPRLFLVSAYTGLYVVQAIYSTRKLIAVYEAVTFQASCAFIFWSGFHLIMSDYPTYSRLHPYRLPSMGKTLLIRPDLNILGVLKTKELYGQTPEERNGLVTVEDGKSVSDLEVYIRAADRRYIAEPNIPGTGIFTQAKEAAEGGRGDYQTEFEKEYQDIQDADLKSFDKAADAALDRIVFNMTLLLGICLAVGFASWTQSPLTDATSTQIGSYALLASTSAAMGVLFTTIFHIGSLERVQWWQLGLSPEFHAPSGTKSQRRAGLNHPRLRSAISYDFARRFSAKPITIFQFWWASLRADLAFNTRARVSRRLLLSRWHQVVYGLLYVLIWRRLVHAFSGASRFVMYVVFGPGFALLPHARMDYNNQVRFDIGDDHFVLHGQEGYTSVNEPE